ncbi:MAG: ABC transporter permease [Alicyclobacillus sp.]|nr:ABC transporter permease [Alicyclobacillus sp.]
MLSVNTRCMVFWPSPKHHFLLAMRKACRLPPTSRWRGGGVVYGGNNRLRHLWIHISTGPFAITWIIGLTSWQFSARTKRSQAMTFRNRDFVVAARLSGASDIWILFHEILPNMLSYVFNNFIWASLAGILAEAGLEFIGIGQPTTPSWGNMLNWAQRGDALLNGGWWWFAPPGLSIAIVGLAFTLINFAMDEVTNPRLRKPTKVRKQKARGLQTPNVPMNMQAEEERA